MPAAFGQTTGQISGTVTDEATQEPLAGVKIVIVETTLETTTGKDGAYKLVSVPLGQYEIKTSRIGYELVSLSVTVSPNEDTKLNVSLRESIVLMPQVVVSAERLVERTSVSDMALTKRMLLSRHGLMEGSYTCHPYNARGDDAGRSVFRFPNLHPRGCPRRKSFPA